MFQNTSRQITFSVLNKTVKLPQRSIFGSLKDFWSGQLNKRVLKYHVVKPGNVTPRVNFPPKIEFPNYALTGIVDPKPTVIDFKTDDEINLMRKSCELARKVLNHIENYLKVGVTTNQIDELVNELCLKYGAYPSPLNYHGYPKSVCTSVNNVACHGIPDDRPLKDGDVITVDVSVFINGFHGDCASSYAIGDVDEKGQRLLKVTKDCLEKAIEICKPNQRLSAIGEIIERTANEAGLEVVPCFCGHGIGRYFHGLPEILHYETNEAGVMLERMIFTIEPVLTEGNGDVTILEDGWTAITTDNSRTAQYEHTVLISNNGVEILTL